MAELIPGFKYIGSLDDLNAYKRIGSDTVFLRTKRHVSKHAMKHGQNYANTRHNYKEFGGASHAASIVKQSMGIGRKITELNIQGKLTGLLRKLAQMDTVSLYGQRHIELSKFPRLLEGFQFSQRNLFESIVQTPVGFTLSRQNLSAIIELPAIMPGLNFKPIAEFPFYRWAITLGIAPDHYYNGDHLYTTRNPYDHSLSKTIAGDWQQCSQTAPATSLVLDLNLTPPDDNFILMLSVSIHFGKMEWHGQIMPVPFAVGGKVVGVV